MSSEPAPDKRELRQKLRVFLRTLPNAESAQASLLARALLREQPVWKNARAVLFYAPRGDEIDLFPLVEEGLRAGKSIALPWFDKKTDAYDAFQIRDAATDCVPGRFGILEPTDQCARFPRKHLDLALVPGVGFDSTGHR